MKKIFFILLAFVAITFVATSCSEDKDDYEYFYGKWHVYGTEGNHGGIFEYPSLYYIFRANGTYETTFGENKIGTYTFDGKSITFDGLFPISVKFSQDKRFMIFNPRPNDFNAEYLPNYWIKE